MLNSFFVDKATLLSSLFFIMGVFVIFQVGFAGIKKALIIKKVHFDEFALRALLGILYILAILFVMQGSVHGHLPSWTIVNFQLVAVIFYTVILSVPYKYHLFTPIVIAFMLFNSAVTNWESWCMAIVLIVFYNTLNYFKDHTEKKFPYFRYLLSSIFFGALYWFFIKLKFSISYEIFAKEVFSLAILEAFTFGYIGILFADVEFRTALFRDATHDKLTSAYNYDAFDIDLRYLFKQVRESNEKFTMMMFDIDQFKNINDTYGHLAGDKVLQNVVDVVQTVIDNNDPKVKLYRTGGEEFNVIFPGYELDDTKNIVREIFSAVNHSETKIDDASIYLTVSMGVSEINETDVSMNDFYSRVDEALYHSKRNGRHEITVVE